MGDVIYQSTGAAARLPVIARQSTQDIPLTQAVRAADWPTFRAAAQLEAVHWLIQALGTMQPFVAVIGDPGVGKSAVAAEAATQLEARGYLVILATPPFAGPLELQTLLAERLGLSTGLKAAPAAIAAALQGRGATGAASKPAVLLIDRAETLPPVILQYLWLMHRLCWIGRPALQVAFVGRPTFWDPVAAPGLSELQNAIAARLVVQPLSGDEALAYLQYRMVLAGAAAPVGIPQRLAPEILALAQGVPSRINMIADVVVAHEPNRLRITQQGVRAAAAMLSGGSALARTPVARRRSAPALVAGAVGAAVLLGSWLLLTRPDAWTPDRAAPAIRQKLAIASAATPIAPAPALQLAQSNPTPAPEPASAPIPASMSAPAPKAAATSLPVAVPTPAPEPAAAPESASVSAFVPQAAMSSPAFAPMSAPELDSAPVSASTSAPASAPTPAPEPASVPVSASAPVPAPAATLPPSLVPTPASAPTVVPVAVAKVAAVAPPIVVLPDAAMPRITVQYSQADPGVAVHARSVVLILRARGLSVGEPAPTPAAAAVRTTEVEYYFAEDRGEAEQLARELGGVVNVGRIDEHNPNLPPPPGTLRVVLASHATPAVAPASASAPTPAGAD